MIQFPKGFFWGSATSAHQVEGGNTNNWSAWEKQHAERLAAESEKKYGHLSMWQEIKRQAQDPHNYISGMACNHYNRFEEDFDSTRSLKHNAHRFSIEWSRIEPKEGVWNEKEIEHYRKVIEALRTRSIEPFATLWHWTIPLWLEKKGGTFSKKFPFYFCRFVEKIVSSYRDQVRFWITLNEPEVYSGLSYLAGQWPPQQKSVFQAYIVQQNLIHAHQKAYHIIHKISSHALVGIAKNNSYFEAFSKNIFDRATVQFNRWIRNELFLNSLQSNIDFIGLNYYFHDRLQFNPLRVRGDTASFSNTKNENREQTDIGWEIYPEGIYHVLRQLKKYQRPIYITENGIADMNDGKRISFIKDHLAWMHKAIQEGVDVRGYFYWSLLDNFEWDSGFWPRFGLVAINYKTLERTIRPSAYEYKKIIENNGF